MIRSLHAVPVMVCLATALVTAQAPAGDRPAGKSPAAEQPREQEPRRTTPSPSAQQPTRPAETSTMAAKKVTYTGCIKPGTTAGTWILENAEVAQRAGAASTPSTVGTSGRARATMSFDLDPAETVNLKPHVNHKVEVVGTLSPAKAGADAAHSTRDAARSSAADARSSTADERSSAAGARSSTADERSSAAGAPSSAAGARSSAAGAATADAHASARQQFSVESLKMVSGTCP